MEISIRPYELSDVNDLKQWACNSEVLQYSCLQYSVLPDSSREDVVNYFANKIVAHPWYRAVCLNGQPVGYISVQPCTTVMYRKGTGEVAYALGRDYWGRGIMASALMVAIPAAFKDMPYLVRIEALIHQHNTASESVLQKVGFLKDGVLRKSGLADGQCFDISVYSILSSDPIA